MKPYFENERMTLYHSDVMDALRAMPAESVHCVVTSPPYWGLRTYGVDGQIGLEQTPAEFVEKMVQVFREVRRVLRKDGTCWVNLGDSYAGGGGYYPDAPSNQAGSLQANGNRSGVRNIQGRAKDRSTRDGLKPKDLVMIPARVALALCDDGWWLRSEITWCKRAPMPESVTDRPTSATEKIYLLAKGERYFYDADAVREPHMGTGGNGPFGGNKRSGGATYSGAEYRHNDAGRNLWNYLPLPADKWRLRADLTPEQRAYVLRRICGVDYPGLGGTLQSSNGHPDV